MYPVLPAQCHGTHRVLRQVIAQLKFWIFQESCKFSPQCERVLAGLAQCTGKQCNGLRCFDPPADLIKERRGCFLTPNMARRNSQSSAASFSRKQFVHSRPQSKLQPGLGDLAAPPRKTAFYRSGLLLARLRPELYYLDPDGKVTAAELKESNASRGPLDERPSWQRRRLAPSHERCC